MLTIWIMKSLSDALWVQEAMITYFLVFQKLQHKDSDNMTSLKSWQPAYGAIQKVKNNAWRIATYVFCSWSAVLLSCRKYCKINCCKWITLMLCCWCYWYSECLLHFYWYLKTAYYFGLSKDHLDLSACEVDRSLWREKPYCSTEVST